MALSLEIVTPGLLGGFGVRPGHTPVVAALQAGELTYVASGSEHSYAVGEGFAEVSDDRLRVLVEEAVRADEIDAARAGTDLADQQKKLSGMKLDDPDYQGQRAKVERAAARAFVASRR